MIMLYILCGLPYSGKSLFSQEAGKISSAKRISFDDSLYELRRENSNTTYEMALYEIALYEIEKELTENLKKGVSVIYDKYKFKRRA